MSKKLLRYDFCDFFFFLFLMLSMFLFTKQVPADDKKVKFVIPQRAFFKMGTSLYNGERDAGFFLYAWAEPSCRTVGNLSVKESYTKNQFVVDIQGYECETMPWPFCYPYTLPGTTGEVLVCPMPMSIPGSVAKIRIRMNWLKEKNKKEVIFRLAGKENRYKISLNQYEVSLTSTKIFNVLDHESRHKPERKLPVVLKVVVYPSDVCILNLNGTLSSDKMKDYGEALRYFAKAHGFILVDEIYEGLLQTKMGWLYVAVRDRPLPKYNDFVGTLENDSNITVHLMKVFDLLDETGGIFAG